MDLALVNGARRTGGRAVHQEASALDLLDVVEADNADVALREALLGHVDFGEHLVGVLAAVHGELPHNPVAVVVVQGVDGRVEVGPAVAVSVGVIGIFELDARSPAVVEQVLALLGDFGVGERRQEGEGLEHPEREGKENKPSVIVFRAFYLTLELVRHLGDSVALSPHCNKTHPDPNLFTK